MIVTIAVVVVVVVVAAAAAGVVVVVVVMSLALSLLLLLLRPPKESSRVCSSEVHKSLGGKGERESSKVCSSEKGGGWGGGAQPTPPPPPLSANLPIMTLFSSLLPPKAISCGFSILCVGEEAFTHLFVLQRRLSFALLCFHAFLLPANTSGFRLLVCR